MTEGGNIHEESSESEKNQTEADRADVRRQNHLLQLNDLDGETAEYIFIYSAVFISRKMVSSFVIYNRSNSITRRIHE